MSRASAVAQARLERHNTRHNTASTNAWTRADPSQEAQLWEPRDNATTTNTDHYPWPLKPPGPGVGGVAGRAKAVNAADRRPFDATTTQSTAYPPWSLPVRRGALPPEPELSADRIGLGLHGLGRPDDRQTPWTSKQEFRAHPPPPSRKEAQQQAEAEQEDAAYRTSVYAWEGEHQLDESTTAKQDYRAWPAARRAERDLLARAAAEAEAGISASASLLEHGGAPKAHRAGSVSRSDYMPRDSQHRRQRGPLEPPPPESPKPFYSMTTNKFFYPEATSSTELHPSWPLKPPGPGVGGVAGRAKAVNAADRRPFDATTTQSTAYPPWSLPVRRGALPPEPELSADRIGLGLHGLGRPDDRQTPWTSKQEFRAHPPPPSRKEAQQQAEAEQEDAAYRTSVYAWEGEHQLDESTTAKQDYRAWPAARRAERDLLARAAAEAEAGISASASLLEHGGAPKAHRAGSVSRSDYMPRDIALPSHTPMAFGLQLRSHGRATFFAMLTSGMMRSEAVVTTVLNGQARVALRVVAAPAVGAVHQVVTSTEPLVLLDEFALSEIDPAPTGTAELLVRFELIKAAGTSSPLLRVTCANQQRGTAYPCVTVPVGEYL